MRNRSWNKITAFVMTAAMLLTLLPGVTVYAAGSDAATEQKPNQPTIAAADISAAIENSRAAVTITESTVSSLIDKAWEQAKTDGKTADGIGVQLNVLFSSTASSIAITVEDKALGLLQSEGVKFFAINNPLVSLSFDTAAIGELNTQTTGAFTITAVPEDKLSDAAAQAVGSRPAYGITISHTKDGETQYVTGLGDGTVTLGIAYTPASGEKTGSLYAAYAPANGKPELLTESSYDNGRIIFSSNTISIYGVGYKTPAPAFTDTTNHWAKDNIDFAASRGLLSGTTATTFAPDTAVTRADFLMAQGKLSGADVSGYTTSSFTDVSKTNPAMPYIEWAVENGVAQGIGGNKFDPGRQITREQMAVMMLNYANATGYTLPVSRTAVTFADDAKISAYAKDAVKAIQKTGVICGKPNNIFDPQGSATRAEAATILRRFVELVIDEGTARGWVKNDAGQQMYYNWDGKPVTGWLTTAGSKYYFDTNGIMQSGKWMEISGNRYYFNTSGKLAVSVSHNPTGSTTGSVTVTVTAENNSGVSYIGWRSSASGASYTGSAGFTDITKTERFTVSSNGWYAVGIVDSAGNFSYTRMQITNISASSGGSSSSGSNGGSSTVAVTGVTLDANALTLAVGGTRQLTATVTPSNATNKSVTWSSSNSSVASVNNSGLVTAVSAGSATITVKTYNGGYTATCAVTVNNLVNAQTPVITGQPTDANYIVGDTATALAVTANVNDGGTLFYQWYSNNVNSNSGGSPVDSNANSYTPPAGSAGTTYYYVVITNANTGVNGNQTASVTSNVAVVTVTMPTYTLTQTLINAASSNTAASVTQGDTFATTFTADTGYLLPTAITVVMGGTPLTVNTEYTYDQSTGAFSIASITGNLEITVTASGLATPTITSAVAGTSIISGTGAATGAIVRVAVTNSSGQTEQVSAIAAADGSWTASISGGMLFNTLAAGMTVNVYQEKDGLYGDSDQIIVS